MPSTATATVGRSRARVEPVERIEAPQQRREEHPREVVAEAVRNIEQPFEPIHFRASDAFDELALPNLPGGVRRDLLKIRNGPRGNHAKHEEDAGEQEE